MKSWPRYAFIALYATGGVYFLLELIALAGLHSGPVTRFLISAGWVGICLTGPVWAGGFWLATQRVRKTILEEEAWLHPLLQELTERARMDRVPELWILEAPEADAYATGKQTIVLSRGLLVQLSEPEIMAVLAHEYGHLKDGDTRAAGAYVLACFVPALLYGLCSRLLRPMLKIAFNRTLTGLMIILLLVLAGYHFPGLLLLTLILFIFIKVFPILQSILSAVWAGFSREDEYRQDRFAQSLGCGRHLKSALLKIDSLHSGGLVSPVSQLWASHPMLYQRIRRLEWLEGLRERP